MYQARPRIQQYTTVKLKDHYFTQDLLPDYQRRHPGELPKVYYEPRGELHEPHGGSLRLGTQHVDAYEFPAHKFDKILVIEKKGLWPVLQAARLADRFDLAIVLSEGYASEACRTLLAKASTDQAYRIFVLHDADPAGYNIARTLREATERMPNYRVDVIDLGLFYAEALAMGIEPETFERKKELPQGLVLSEVERRAFEGRQVRKGVWIAHRVELNALPNPALITYIERGLERHGATSKIIPPRDVLEAHYRSSVEAELYAAIRERLEEEAQIDKRAVEETARVLHKWEAMIAQVVATLPDTVAECLRQQPEMAWANSVVVLAKQTSAGEGGVA
jgi:hypothetical protein